MKKMKAIDVFSEFVKENGRYPTREEFEEMGYSRSSYFKSKRAYNPVNLAEEIIDDLHKVTDQYSDEYKEIVYKEIDMSWLNGEDVNE